MATRLRRVHRLIVVVLFPPLAIVHMERFAAHVIPSPLDDVPPDWQPAELARLRLAVFV